MLKHFCHPGILHFLMADNSIGIACKELIFAQDAKFN